MRLVPRTLTTRLVVTAVALVAVVSLLVALVTTLAMSRYLVSRQDSQLQDTQQRAQRNGPAPSAPTPNGSQRGFRPFVAKGTLFVQLSGSDSGTRQQQGVTNDDGDVKAISSTVRRQLRGVSVDDHPHTVDLSGLGSYRVLVGTDSDGNAFAVGVSMEEIHRAEASLLRWSLLLTVGGVLVAAGAGTILVRRQLHPLHEVAATAYDVTAIPLEAGGQSIETRVDARYTDPHTEVGRVGSALNTLLDHVDAALDARHRSEQHVRQFVADASHELRTPLSTIHGYAELSRRTPDDPEALTAAMNKVETEATRMTSLVNDLLLLARLDSGRPLEREEVDLTRLLLEAVADARVVAPDHEWRLDLPDEPVGAVGDEQRLHQVVTNLINNARRHTPPGTTVTVGVRPRPADGEPVTVTVHDDGPGVPAELADHVFERFTRGDSSRTRASGGAGLGLSLVQAITEAHGGTARLGSRPGSTTFTLLLP
ncbi:sensor histidine kinase [Nocardioides mangrovicus]|uniref:histidine kinase n=1 Tax=Nocardioides mangrovicus TaxID=2478913 RepID=A0A3L8P2U6_9ACTN|nr:ATP-binding protein [Nocardioides mangrovicus]RLV49173.1 sensor histidine kinase [Nocardioides mangrovicus]